MKPRLLIYIPTRNSSNTIISVLKRIPKNFMSYIDKILIVDNCSIDDTIKKIREYKNTSKLGKRIAIIKNKKDRGYGGSQKVGYRYGIDNKYDYVVMLHSDGQYPPEYIPPLYKKIQTINGDLVFGSRIAGEPFKGKMSVVRYGGNRVLTLLENIALGTKLSEFHSGFRIFNVRSLKAIPFERCTNNYYFDSQIMFLHVRNKRKIGEIVIPTNYGKESQSPSWIELISYSLNILKEILLYILRFSPYS
ncbi:glycosyltransferase family 2 protein [Candidatus Woesearchaeota archaeon]|nr:glycosyltransferase family 2 protein [Candidatus Woesearchaeota archaeon]